MRYLLVDTANTFFRARHAAHRQSDTWDKLGFALHVTLGSVNKAWRDQKADHVVFCLEGRSWRKDFYEPYKKNRAVARAALTEKEAEEDKLFWETLDELKTYITDKTNCTVLQHPNLEADDLIAGWIQSHPDDEHVIVSSDSDFHQLLAENVKQYNGVADELHTLEGIFDKKGEEHYNTISAYIKSMRASQVDAALYYLARMVEAGEDPLFIARRMVIFAAEDIGLAQPTAQVVANAVFDACHKIGYPEAGINLAFGTAYLAQAKKDRSAYDAFFAAMDDVKKHGNLPIPLSIRNAPTETSGSPSPRMRK